MLQDAFVKSFKVTREGGAMFETSVGNECPVDVKDHDVTSCGYMFFKSVTRSAA